MSGRSPIIHWSWALESFLCALCPPHLPPRFLATMMGKLLLSHPAPQSDSWFSPVQCLALYSECLLLMGGPEESDCSQSMSGQDGAS